MYCLRHSVPLFLTALRVQVMFDCDLLTAVRVIGIATAIYTVIGGIKAGFEAWEEALDAQPVTPVEDESYGVPMLYSSGTTGKPTGTS